MCADLKDMSLMVLRTRGPAKLPKGYKLTMHISQSDAESVRVFRSKLTGKQNSECSFGVSFENTQHVHSFHMYLADVCSADRELLLT